MKPKKLVSHHTPQSGHLSSRTTYLHPQGGCSWRPLVNKYNSSFFQVECKAQDNVNALFCRIQRDTNLATD